MSTAILFGLHYSPWTERARWALDHHRVGYRYREHLPLLGEPLLRWRARGRAAGPATVPLLRVDGQVLCDSAAILRYAESVAGGEALIDADADADANADAELSAWIAKADAVLAKVRVRVTRRTLADPQALEEAAGAALPRALAFAARPMAATAARFLARKHGFSPAGASEVDGESLRRWLDGLRERLDGRPYLGSRFGAADIVAATLLQAVEPWLPLGQATRRVWRDAALAERYADLLAWRDGLYAAHRHPRGD